MRKMALQCEKRLDGSDCSCVLNSTEAKLSTPDLSRLTEAQRCRSYWLRSMSVSPKTT